MIPLIDVTRSKPVRPSGRKDAARIKCGDIEVDARRYRALRGGRPLELGTRELHILALLMSRPGVVHSRDQILDAVWGADAAVTDRNVDAYIKRLRKMLKAGADIRADDPIRTVRGVGYAFDEFYEG